MPSVSAQGERQDDNQEKLREDEQQNKKDDRQNKKDDQKIKTDDQQIKTDDQKIKTDDQKIKTDDQKIKRDGQQIKTDANHGTSRGKEKKKAGAPEQYKERLEEEPEEDEARDTITLIGEDMICTDSVYIVKYAL